MESVSGSRAALMDELWQSPSGLHWCRRHTASVDAAVRTLYQAVLSEIGEAPALSLVATGGYGRHELSPYSDIDLCLVPLDEQHPGMERMIRALFQSIQREMHARNYRVGYSYRLISDVPGIDATTLSGLLDARLVAGDSQPFELLMESMWNHFPVGEYLLAKLAERQAAVRKTHDTPLVVQPNLKEGAGGLRSFQTANWIRAAIGLRPINPTSAYDRVLRVRNLLHANAGRLCDDLSRVRQAEICERLGLDLFRWMSELAQAMEELESGYCESVAELKEARYPLHNSVYALRGELRVAPDASLSDAALGVSSALQLGLQVSELPSFAATSVDPGRVLPALASGAQTVRAWSDAGLLPALLPELEACRTLLPRDASHAFTVYEHSLRATEFFDQLAGDDGWLGSLAASVQDNAPLVLALLLHDVGKVETDRPHSDSGAEISAAVCRRWHLERGLAETVVWLVQHHLAMAKTMRMRDLQNPETAIEFAEVVGSPERLALLTLLTYCDIRAVSDDAWTAATEAFLHELWCQTLDVLEAGRLAVPDSDTVVRLAADRSIAEWSVQDIARFLDSLPAHYALTTQPDRIGTHLALAARAREREVAIEIEDTSDRRMSEVTVVCRDAAGLLGRILGVLYAYDLSLIAFRAHTTTGPEEFAIDVFSVSFGGKPLPKATAGAVAAAIESVLLGKAQLEDLLLKKAKDPDRKQEIYRYHYIPGNPGILEIQAPRGRGMAFRMARLIAEHGWEIQAARLGQWAGQGAAAFYLTGPDHRPLSPDEIDLALSPP